MGYETTDKQPGEVEPTELSDRVNVGEGREERATPRFSGLSSWAGNGAKY